MKLCSGIALGIAAFLLSANCALADGWALSPATSERELNLILGSEDKPVYLFACEASAVRITNFGVTELLDLQTGQKVGDGPEAIMPPGASLMALFTGKGQPDFKPAEAVHNAETGWDLTMRLGKTDKQLKLLTKSDVISLFTTGYTQAVGLDSEDRALARDFLNSAALLSRR